MVMAMRHTFDFASGYTIGRSLNTLDERAVLVRCIFLETVAGKFQLYVIHFGLKKNLLFLTASNTR